MSVEVAVCLPFCAEVASAGFCPGKNEIATIPWFEVQGGQSQPVRLPLGLRLTQPPLQLDKAAPGSACHGFGSADDIHLGEDRFHVRFHGAFADE
jgi:hypothetical protein